MKLGLYSIRDEKAKAYVMPFFRQEHGEAIRYFGDAVGNKDTMFHKHPEDYILYYHGDFDILTGRITGINEVDAISRATDFITTNGEQQNAINPTEINKTI